MNDIFSKPCRRLIQSALVLVLAAAVGRGLLEAQTVLPPPQIDGSKVTLHWNSGGAIQIAPEVTGPWTTLSNGVSIVGTANTTLLNAARFFRIVDGILPGEAQPILPEGLGVMPPIQSAFIQRLPQPAGEGNAVLTIRFVEGTIPRALEGIIPIVVDDRLVFLNDRGRFPDANANDGVFSMAIDLNAEEIKAANTRLSQLPPSRQFTRQFVDRKVVGPNIPLTGFPLNAFLDGALVPLIGTNAFGKLKLNCPAGSPLAYDWHKTLMITHLSVVQDLTRTWDPCGGPGGTGTKLGVWTFGTLMKNICNEPATGIPAEIFARDFMRTWEFDQTVNSDVVPARPGIKTDVVNDWLARSLANGFPEGQLDLSIAPFRLCAIVNRVDLRSNTGFTYPGGSSVRNPCEPVCRGGEARFVFCAVDVAHGCAPLPFLLIFEYCVPGETCEKIKAWGAQWSALDALPFGPPVGAFNIALAAITAQFTAVNAVPSRPPNRSSINQIRSNEIGSGLPWELREWRLSVSGSDAGFLRQATVVNTPDADLNNLPVIGSTPVTKINPPPAPFNPYLGGTAPETIVWNSGALVPGTLLMHNFALNTCNGCHTVETGTKFLHVGCRDFGSLLEAPLSGFLTGITGVTDPRPAGAPPVGPHAFADLDRRVIDLDELVNCPCNPFQLVFEPLAVRVPRGLSALMAH